MKVALIFVLTFIAAPVFAQQVYKCDLKKNSPYGGIPSELYIQINDNEKTAFVMDSFIKQYMVEPTKADLSIVNSSNYELNWTVPNIRYSNSKHTTNAQFNARWNRPTGRMNMTVYLSGGTDMPPPTGSGMCKPYKR